MSAPFSPVRWTSDRRALVILDQTRLPQEEIEIELHTIEEVFEAIRALRVRGAPLIGITAAMGIATLARQSVDSGSDVALSERVRRWCDYLSGARPTAVNLGWALARLRRVADSAVEAPAVEAPAALAEALVAEAEAIRDEDARMCRRIGEHAVHLLRNGSSVLTHCNAGALATSGIGTALAPLYVARERGTRVRVIVGETRPLLQGSRLTAWELARAGIDVTVMADSMAATLFRSAPPDLVLVGSDRIAANGDVANKIGTYGLAVLASHHEVPFYVLAPTSTIDLATPTGADIPIEHRDPEEVRRGFGRLTVPEAVEVWSPAFDVTPAELVTAVVTEHGISHPPFADSLREAVGASEPDRVGP